MQKHHKYTAVCANLGYYMIPLKLMFMLPCIYLIDVRESTDCDDFDQISKISHNCFLLKEAFVVEKLWTVLTMALVSLLLKGRKAWHLIIRDSTTTSSQCHPLQLDNGNRRLANMSWHNANSYVQYAVWVYLFCTYRWWVCYSCVHVWSTVGSLWWGSWSFQWPQHLTQHPTYRGW